LITNFFLYPKNTFKISAMKLVYGLSEAAGKKLYHDGGIS